MSETSYICNRTQQAVAAFLDAQTYSTDLYIYKGIEHGNIADREQDSKELPCAIAVCQEAVPDSKGGRWVATVTVQLHTNADDTTEDEHHAIAGEVFDTLFTDTIAEDLSAAQADYYVGLVNFRRQSWDIVERRWVAQFEFEVHCYGKELS